MVSGPSLTFMLVVPQSTLLLPRGSVLWVGRTQLWHFEYETCGTVKGVIIIMNTWLLLMTRVSANKETSFDTCSAVLLDMSGIRWQTSLFFSILFAISAQDGFFWCCWLITPASFSGENCKKKHWMGFYASYVFCLWQTYFDRSNNNERWQMDLWLRWQEILVTNPQVREQMLYVTHYSVWYFTNKCDYKQTVEITVSAFK